MSPKRTSAKSDRAANLLAAWPEVRERIAGAPKLFIGLDFDGTLSPIVQHFADARLPGETKGLIARLAKLPGVEVAIVSGRALDDLKSRVGLGDITYIATHGFDIERRGRLWHHPRAPEFKRVTAQVAKELARELAPFKGVNLEPKGYTLAVHYRQAPDAKTVAMAKRAFERVVSPWREAGEVRVTLGKRLLEVRPGELWGKGHGLAMLLGGPGADARKIVDTSGAFTGDAKDVLALYIGDDETDEDGFKAIRRIGITARVGGTTVPTAAEYRLASIAEVRQFLELVAGTR